MDFTIYSANTGEVLFCGSAYAPIDLMKTGQALLEHVKHGDGYIVDGIHHELPPQPSPSHIFDYIAKQWIDPRTLQDFKDTQWSQIKQARQSALTAPLTTAYGIFDADDSAQANLMKSVVLANNLTALGMPVAIDYTLANNTTVLLNAAQMIEVGLTLAAREQAVRGKATLLRAAIEAATTQGEVEAVVWG